jgi:hypothetical protein
MAKDTSNSSFVMIAIVAVVTIVGMVTIFLNSGVKIGLAIESDTLSADENLAGKAAVTSKCTDSDGGKNYYTYGFVTYKSTQYPDACAGSYVLEKYCYANAKGQLVVGSEKYACPNGCQARACKKTLSIANKIGNPGLSQFPNMNSADRLARGVKDLQSYQGRIFVGTGDFINNRGPIKIWSFDGKSTPTFKNEILVDEEEASRFKVYNNILYVPGTDARESQDFGNFYFKKNGVWTKKRTIPGAVHVVDIAEANGTLCVADSGTNRDGHSFGSHLLTSSDGGNSWTIASHPYDTSNYYNDIMSITSWKDKFLAYIMAYNYPPISFSARGLLRSEDNNTFTFTGIPFKPIQVFGEKMFGYCTDTNQYCSSNDLQTFSYLDQFSPREEYNLADQIVVEDKMYILFRQNPSPDFKYYTGSVYSSKNLTQWIREFSFDFPAMPNRIEFLNGSFYIGLSSNYVINSTGYTYIDNEAGSIWKITPR